MKYKLYNEDMNTNLKIEWLLKYIFVKFGRGMFNFVG